MTAIGGSSPEVSINGRIFTITDEADLEISLQQYENEAKTNGDGSIRMIRKRVNQKVEGVSLVIDDDQNDHEALVKYSESNEMLDCTFALASGRVYMGKGQIVGEVKRKTQDPTCDVSFALQNMKAQ